LVNYAGSIMEIAVYCNSATDQSEKKASHITHNDGQSQSRNGCVQQRK